MYYFNPIFTAFFQIGMNCSPPNVSHVGFLLKLETVGLRLLITTTIANALTAHYAKRTSKEKVSLSRLVNHFVKAMPGWESDSILHQYQPKLYIELWAFLSTPHLLRRNIKIFQEWSWTNKSVNELRRCDDFLFTKLYTVLSKKKKRNLLTSSFMC
jgi:hypothetical protein